MVKRVDEDVSDLKECEWRAVKPGGLDTTLVFFFEGQCFETSGEYCRVRVFFSRYFFFLIFEGGLVEACKGVKGESKEKKRTKEGGATVTGDVSVQYGTVWKPRQTQ